MNLVEHYNDLTEINQLRVHGDFYKDLTAIEKKCKTRILFTDAKTNYDTCGLLDQAEGWKIARKTLDWHSWHGGDCELRLYYKLFTQNNSVGKKGNRSYSTFSCHHSLSGSCSMGLWDKLDEDWIVNMKVSYPERYLTLIRLDRKRTKEEIAKMRYYRYRLVFKSDVARYFANGWEPNEWPGFKEEKGFWTTNEAPKKHGFVYTP
jgi:hypothetical protein